MQQRDVVIIGGGTAGRTVVHALHAANQAFTVTVIKDEEFNLNRTVLPYGIDPQTPVEKLLLPNKLITYFGADLVIDTVAKIQPETSQLTTLTGATFEYKWLVLAAGAQPVIPPILGVDAPQVLALRSRYDLLALRDLAQKSRQAVILGSDDIGLEVAASLRTLGLQVTIIEHAPHLLFDAVAAETAVELAQHLQTQGVEVCTNAQIIEIVNTHGQVEGVQFADHSVVAADFIVLARGVAPEVELAQQAGLKTSKFGIVTDAFLRTSVPNIYAVGDCAEKKSFITQRPVRGESEANAIFMAKVAGANILGEPASFPGAINARALTVFDLSYGAAGLTEKEAAAEMDVVCGSSEVLSKYPLLDGAERIKTRLLFDQSTRKLVGGSVLRAGRSVAAHVDFLALAIQMGVTLPDLLHYQYATHPELTAKASDNMYVLAAQDALKKL